MGTQTHLVDGVQVGGDRGEGRGGEGGEREGSEGRRGEGEEEGGEGGVESGRSGRGGGTQERANGVRTRGAGGGGGRGGEIFGGLGRISKMFLLVSTVNIHVGVSLLKTGEFKMQGIEGESSKEQSAGERMTSGSDWSSTVLETVGKVE